MLLKPPCGKLAMLRKTGPNPKTETRRAATLHSKEPRELEPDGVAPGRESRSGPLAIELR
jgi:hypothetical protein